MEQFLQRANVFFELVPDAVRRHKRMIWVLFVLLSTLVVYGAQRFQVDMTLEAYFQKDDPIKLAYDRFKAEFGSDEVLFLTYEAKDGDVLSAASLGALKELHDELENYRLTVPQGESSGLDHITEVTSLINASYMESTEGTLLSRALVGDVLPGNETEREQLRERALNHPDFPNVYISRDASFGSIVINTNLGATLLEDKDVVEGVFDSGDEEALDDESDALDDEQYADFDMDTQWQEPDQSIDQLAPKFERVAIEDYASLVKAVEQRITKPRYTEHLTFYPVGTATMLTFFNDEIISQMAIVFAGAISLIMLMLWILFRSLSAVVWSLCIVIMSFLWVVGLIGWSGATMTTMINIIVFLVIAVGVADAVHILSGYLFFCNEGQAHQQALRSVFKKSGLACFLTSLTTAIGLLALTFVPIIPVRNFGIFAAIGVLVAFLLTVFILPLMLDIWAPVRRKESDAGQVRKRPFLQKLLRKVEHIGYTYPKINTVIFSVLMVYLLIGITHIKVDSNMMEMLPKESYVRQSVDRVDKHMAGSAVMDIIFDAGQSDAFNDPIVLNQMEQLQAYIESQYPGMVGKTSSLVNVSKDAYKALNDDDPAMYKIPQDSTVLTQTLFMFNNANPKDRRQLVSDDYSKARMTITLKSAGSYVYMDMMEDIQAEIDRLFSQTKHHYPDMDIRLTGNMSLMIRLVDYISWSQIKSFGIALLVISVLLLVVFGSKRIGVIALMPNVLPIILAFGLMGHLGISLDTDTLLVAPIIIGIAVDDTIHFLTHYRASVLQTGDIPAAIRQTIREAGQAITFTSLVLSLGFLVFLFSSHLALRNFGILSSMSIMFALITDLFLLPALCTLFKADFDYAKNRSMNKRDQGVVEEG